MKVRKITHKNLAEAFGSVDIELPDRGLVLVTGKNGSGKTTGTLEAVSAGLFDEQVASDTVWRHDTAAMIQVTLDSGVVLTRRMAKGGTKKLEVTGTGYDEAITGTKAKENVAKYMPSHSLWVNSCVLSVQTLGAFSTAADKARKTIVEELLGLGYLDKAHKAAEAEYREAKASEHTLNLARVRAEGEANTAAATLRALQSSVSAPSESEIQSFRDRVITLQEQKSKLDAEIGASQALVNETTLVLNRITQGVSAARGSLHQLQVQRASMLGGNCPTCGQSVAGEDTSTIDAAIYDATTAIKQAEARNTPELKQQHHAHSTSCEALIARRNEASVEIATVTARGMAAKRQQQDEASLTSRIEQATASGVNAEADKVASISNHDAKKLEMEHLDHARAALGVRGVRTYLLPEALAAITAVANSWLSVISGPDFSLQVFEENDKIMLTFEGRGRGTYGTLSYGYQRRADLALLLAFSEVARQSLRTDSVTLFCDEPFLGFDAEGIEVVSGVLNRLSKDHCIVVITNQPHVVRSLKPDVHYHVSNGEYRREA